MKYEMENKFLMSPRVLLIAGAWAARMAELKLNMQIRIVARNGGGKCHSISHTAEGE